ncbi:MAG: glucosyl transferase [Ignavibacteriales bacterium]|nr:MAG: glucosyl transferase [Ignavibacteriales bacterium]
MRFKLVFTFFVISVLALIGCDSNEPEENSKLKLTVEDVSCTEAWLKISDAKGSLITLKRDNKEIMQFKLTGTDTIVVDDSLLPTKTYRYQVFSLPAGQAGIQYPTSSIEVPVTTMDTTSHNFTWQSWTFGENGAGSSTLYDVAIIDESNIWAVGSIYIKDSLGNPDPHSYNVAHWNGLKWELKRINFYTICGHKNLTPYPAKSIFAIDKNEILIAMDGDQIAKLENGIQVDQFCLPSFLSMSINKLWGNNSKDYYIIGNRGNIAHYENGNWHKIDTGNEWDIYDMFGYTNSFNKVEIICAATDPNDYSNSVIYKITDEPSLEFIRLNTKRLTGSVWTNKGNILYVCGDGIFTNKSGKWEEEILPVNYVTSKIRGNNLNDIFVCGVLGLIAHYNGINWKVYNDNQNTIYSAVNIKENITAFAGWRNGQAVITIGKRN